MKATIELGGEEHFAELVNSAVLMILDSEGREVERETTERGVRAVLDNPGRGYYVVAKVDDKFAGSLFVNNIYLDLTAGFIWWINCVHVREEFRQQGLYDLMYDFVRKKAESQDDVIALRLLVHPENEKAKHAYLRTGMSELPYLVYQQKL